ISTISERWARDGASRGVCASLSGGYSTGCRCPECTAIWRTTSAGGMLGLGRGRREMSRNYFKLTADGRVAWGAGAAPASRRGPLFSGRVRLVDAGLVRGDERVRLPDV